MVTELLDKYIWLIQKFITAGDRGLNLEELGKAWERKFGSRYARRSFNNHREAVAEVFGIEIECNRSTNRYFIRLHYSNVILEDISAMILAISDPPIATSKIKGL